MLWLSLRQAAMPVLRMSVTPDRSSQADHRLADGITLLTATDWIGFSR